MARIAINGFGRIGRLAFRLVNEDESFEIVAVNDLADAKTLAHLLKYDTVHSSYRPDSVTWEEGAIIVGGKRIPVFAERDPLALPWKELEVDAVLECSGRFTDLAGCEKHIQAGARKAIVSAPGKGGMKTVVYNVNHGILDGTETVISGASCTTNCLAPMVKALDDAFGVEYGFMTTVHAYTNDQMVLDGNHKDLRRARAAAVNIIPTTTGAASAVGDVLPHLKGKLDGYALRVPVMSGSLVDFTCSLSKEASIESLREAFLSRQSETLGATDDPIVSSDIIGMGYASLIDLPLLEVMTAEGRQLVKVVSWYDNEMSYTHQLVRLMRHFAQLGK
ncbi:MAG: type I glyceraldehyde-3-phosphate dehydrogenase [Eubacteriaceae bacterium]|nr:type I glyceraldehyde-3-phosphate dehydrogenase [Eubacteriaceae bacterium]